LCSISWIEENNFCFLQRDTDAKRLNMCYQDDIAEMISI